MTRTSDTKVTFTGIGRGQTYTFEVVAILEELQSDPASISIRIEEAEEPAIEEPVEPVEPVEPEEPIKEEPEDANDHVANQVMVATEGDGSTGTGT